MKTPKQLPKEDYSFPSDGYWIRVRNLGGSEAVLEAITVRSEIAGPVIELKKEYKPIVAKAAAAKLQEMFRKPVKEEEI